MTTAAHPRRDAAESLVRREGQGEFPQLPLRGSMRCGSPGCFNPLAHVFAASSGLVVCVITMSDGYAEPLWDFPGYGPWDAVCYRHGTIEITDLDVSQAVKRPPRKALMLHRKHNAG